MTGILQPEQFSFSILAGRYGTVRCGRERAREGKRNVGLVASLLGPYFLLGDIGA